MTWQEAKSAAVPLAEHLLRERPDGSRPTVSDLIGLTDFEDEASHDFFKPEDRWSLTFHRMINKAVLRELSRRGYTVAVVKIGLAEYYDWLPRQSRPDDANARADFAAEKTQNEIEN